MKIKIRTKYDVPLIEYTLNQKGEEAYKRIPDLSDHIVIDDERYLIVDRTFNLDKDEVILQAWKPVVGEEDEL